MEYIIVKDTKMIQPQEFKELLARKKELTLVTQKLDKYSLDLLETKRKLVDKIDELMEVTIKPLKEEIAQIDAEIETVMKETDTDKLVSNTYGAYMKEQLALKVTDPSKALAWLKDYPECIKKDIIKNKELCKLIDDGVVPDPDKDGIDASGVFTKVTFRRR
jgi:dsDNA-specific endonuclease/ATPase MutS2